MGVYRSIGGETCPKCSSLEWFPGAACFSCGWEGSAADAFAVLRERIARLRRLAKLSTHPGDCRLLMKCGDECVCGYEEAKADCEKHGDLDE